MIRAAIHFLRLLRNFAARWALRFLSFARVISPRVQLHYLRWARDDMGPLHPELPEVVREIAELETVYG